MYKKLRWGIGALWCSLMHNSVTWPIHGYYECRTCGRRYLAFADTPTAILAMTLMPLALPVPASGLVKGHMSPEVEAAFEQYLAGGARSPWALEYEQIGRSLNAQQRIWELPGVIRSHQSR